MPSIEVIISETLKNWHIDVKGQRYGAAYNDPAAARRAAIEMAQNEAYKGTPAKVFELNKQQTVRSLLWDSEVDGYPPNDTLIRNGSSQGSK